MATGAALPVVDDEKQGGAGFSALGRRGKPAEAAVQALIRDLRSGAALDEHLGDQMLLPATLAEGTSMVTVEGVSRHLTTNTWVIERFGLAEIEVRQPPGKPALVCVHGAGLKPWT